MEKSYNDPNPHDIHENVFVELRENYEPKLSFKHKLFSLKNVGRYKVMWFLGLKFKFKSKFLVMQERWYKDHLYLYNLKYEIADELKNNPEAHKAPKVLTIDETLDEIINNKKSICRYGDGEYLTLVDKVPVNYYKQKYNKKLIQRLRDILVDNSQNILVCLSDTFGSLNHLTQYEKNIARYQLNIIRYDLYKYLDFNKIYGNAFLTRVYMMLNDKQKAAHYFNRWKNVWDKKDIVIVEGEKSRLGIGNDLFNNANSIERIICPAESAFDKYDEILKYTKTLPKDKLVFIALGMTATVLAYDLAKEGFWAIDIGHIDLEYEWFLMQTDVRIPIKHKYIQDLEIHKTDELKDTIYTSQIIKKIV